MAEESGGGARPEILGWVPKLGVWAWSFVGFVVAMVTVVTALAAGLIVLGLLALMALVVAATVRGVVEQTDQIGASVDAGRVRLRHPGSAGQRPDPGRAHHVLPAQGRRLLGGIVGLIRVAERAEPTVRRILS